MCVEVINIGLMKRGGFKLLKQQVVMGIYIIRNKDDVVIR